LRGHPALPPIADDLSLDDRAGRRGYDRLVVPRLVRLFRVGLLPPELAQRPRPAARPPRLRPRAPAALPALVLHGVSRAPAEPDRVRGGDRLQHAAGDLLPVHSPPDAALGHSIGPDWTVY